MSQSLKPLHGTSGKPIYAFLSKKPIYADGGVIPIGSIYIEVAWSAYPDLDIAVGYTGSTGVGWNVTAGTSAEMSTLYWITSDNTQYGPERVRIDAGQMTNLGCGRHNDGTNDYYEIRINVGWYTSGATGEGCWVTATFDGLSVGPFGIAGLPNNNGGQATWLGAVLRWTPATGAFVLI